jgi:UDP-4-amino-4,6-dideoxy-N-acetyl-beta-L-altrosamine N-acetyltransferase
MIELVPLKKNHLELVLEWRTNSDITKYMDTDIEKDLVKQYQWYQLIKKDKSSIYWIIKYKNKPVGLNSLNNIDWKNQYCFGGYYLSEMKYRSLLGAYIPNITLNYIFTSTCLNKSIANIFLSNKNVVDLYKNIGYREVGVFKDHIYKNGKMYDMIYLELLKKDWEKKEKYFSNYKGKIYEGT